jgi:hypothetical protein
MDETAKNLQLKRERQEEEKRQKMIKADQER